MKNTVSLSKIRDRYGRKRYKQDRRCIKKFERAIKKKGVSILFVGDYFHDIHGGKNGS